MCLRRAKRVTEKGCFYDVRDRGEVDSGALRTEVSTTERRYPVIAPSQLSPLLPLASKVSADPSGFVFEPPAIEARTTPCGMLREVEAEDIAPEEEVTLRTTVRLASGGKV